MEITSKDLKRKIENRGYGIGNVCYEIVNSESDAEDKSLWSVLNENILEANASKYFDGYLPIISHRKIIGKYIVLMKRGIRKLIKIFFGWYIFPIYQRQSYFNGKIVNALTLERDTLQDFNKKINELENNNANLMQMIDKLENSNTNLIQIIDEHRKSEAYYTTEIKNLQFNFKKLKNNIENLPTNDDEFYHCFEEKFRGDRNDIKTRLKIYVPKIKKIFPELHKCNCIDIGSGRGEWLDILQDNSVVQYVGVDINEKQNTICRTYGHEVICKDCIQYLKSLPKNSVDLITGFQIIEHLYLSDLVELFQECYRVLKENGAILFETQNPRNLIVGADTFYIDPSHKRPLDPRMVEFLVAWCGYKDVECIDTNSHPASKKIYLSEKDKNSVEHEVIEQFNDMKWLLYGPQDYAILAIKGEG